MPKFDKTRNYYADLEVSPNASVDDVKRQFKKLGNSICAFVHDVLIVYS